MTGNLLTSNSPLGGLLKVSTSTWACTETAVPTGSAWQCSTSCPLLQAMHYSAATTCVPQSTGCFVVQILIQYLTFLGPAGLISGWEQPAHSDTWVRCTAGNSFHCITWHSLWPQDLWLELFGHAHSKEGMEVDCGAIWWEVFQAASSHVVLEEVKHKDGGHAMATGKAPRLLTTRWQKILIHLTPPSLNNWLWVMYPCRQPTHTCNCVNMVFNLQLTVHFSMKYWRKIVF